MWHLQRAMLLWMMDAAQRDAMLLYEAMQGIGTKDSALIGIICSRTPSQLYAIKQAYHTMYRRTLEHHIDGDTSGDYRKVSKRNTNPKFIKYVAIFRHQLFFRKKMYI
jgi:annexin A7/11